MSASHKQPLLNYGERLYQKGIKNNEEKERCRMQAKAQQEKEQVEQFPFAPQINPVSRMLGRPYNERAEDALINFARAKQDRIEQLRSEQQQNE